MPRPNLQPRKKTFARNIRALIANRGWTQREAAEQLNIPYTTIRKYCGEGLASKTEKNSPFLDAICQWFVVEDCELLWSTRLHTRRIDPIKDYNETKDVVIWQLKQILNAVGNRDRRVKRIVKSVDRLYGRIFHDERTDYLVQTSDTSQSTEVRHNYEQIEEDIDRSELSNRSLEELYEEGVEIDSLDFEDRHQGLDSQENLHDMESPTEGVSDSDNPFDSISFDEEL